MQFVENVNGHIVFHPGVIITSLIQSVCDMVGWWGLLLLVVALVHAFNLWWFGAFDNVDLRGAKEREADERKTNKVVKDAMARSHSWSFDQDGSIEYKRGNGRWQESESGKEKDDSFGA